MTARISPAGVPATLAFLEKTFKEMMPRFEYRHSFIDDDFRLKAIVDILQSKCLKRGISLRSLQYGKAETASGTAFRAMGLQTVPADERLRLSLPGGAGWGDPLARPPGASPPTSPTASSRAKPRKGTTAWC